MIKWIFLKSSFKIVREISLEILNIFVCNLHEFIDLYILKTIYRLIYLKTEPKGVNYFSRNEISWETN